MSPWAPRSPAVGSIEEAEPLLDRGLANLRVRGQPLEVADSLLVAAPVRRALEGPASARALLDEAKSLVDELFGSGRPDADASSKSHAR